jgi:hypothetical protein
MSADRYKAYRTCDVLRKRPFPSTRVKVTPKEGHHRDVAGVMRGQMWSVRSTKKDEVTADVSGGTTEQVKATIGRCMKRLVQMELLQLRPRQTIVLPMDAPVVSDTVVEEVDEVNMDTTDSSDDENIEE